MPWARVNGARIAYRVLGTTGPWLALAPRGREPMAALEPLADLLAGAGHRVLLHDRRNCGDSDLLLVTDRPEHEVWADDLEELLRQLDARPAWVGGSSSGARMALSLATRRPSAVRGLLLWRITGGDLAADRLAERYAGEQLRVLEHGGLEALAATDDLVRLIAARPEHRDRLLALDAELVAATLRRWRDELLAGAEDPVLGFDEATLRSIEAPACVVPGNDRTHPREVGERLARLLPRGQVAVVAEEHRDVDSAPAEEWEALAPRLAVVFADTVARDGAGPSPPP